MSAKKSKYSAKQEMELMQELWTPGLAENLPNFIRFINLIIYRLITI